MGDQIMTLREVQPRTRKWTVKVQVIEKNYPRCSQNSRLFQRLILRDCEGTRVQATIFGSDIELFQHTLKEYQKYHISNALVKHIQPNYRVIENNFQWIINGATLVEEIKSVSDAITQFRFIPFTELNSHRGPDSSVDIIAATVQIAPPRKLTTLIGEPLIQELLLVTKELKPTILTMWDQYIDNECKIIAENIDTWPIIIGMRLKVPAYNGPSLSTRSSSCVMINPDIPEKETLRSWCNEHRNQIEALILATPIQQTQATTVASNTTNVITAQTAKNLETMETFRMNATAFISNFTQRFWYVGCSNCHKAIHTECGKSYTCIYCKKPVTAHPRCRFDVELLDSTGYITANCFGHHAEKLFAFTAEDLKEHTDENDIIDRKFLENNLSTSTHLFHLKPYNFTLGSRTQRRLTIISIEDESGESSTSTHH